LWLRAEELWAKLWKPGWAHLGDGSQVGLAGHHQVGIDNTRRWRLTTVKNAGGVELGLLSGKQSSVQILVHLVSLCRLKEQALAGKSSNDAQIRSAP